LNCCLFATSFCEEGDRKTTSWHIALEKSPHGELRKSPSNIVNVLISSVRGVVPSWQSRNLQPKCPLGRGAIESEELSLDQMEEESNCEWRHCIAAVCEGDWFGIERITSNLPVEKGRTAMYQVLFGRNSAANCFSTVLCCRRWDHSVVLGRWTSETLLLLRTTGN
jgi:hypothetical protein